MREIKLTIEKEEDIVLMIQGLNWIRQHGFEQAKKCTDMMELLKKEKKQYTREETSYHTALWGCAETHCRIMSLIAQLDKHLEDKKSP